MDSERPCSTKYGVPYEKWEEGVVVDAAYFTLTKFLGSCRYDRREFNDPHEALEALKALPDPDRWMMYAVTASGHQVHMERAKYQHFLDLYDKWRKPDADGPRR